MLRTKMLPAAMAAAIAVGAGGAAFAATHDREDAKDIAAVLNAKTSLAEAIATAEQQVGGKAIDAGLEREGGPMRFEVEVAKDKTVQRVLVDPQTGKVVKVMPADTGENGENGEHGED